MTSLDANDPTSVSQDEDSRDFFTQFQLKEYENISQAHFKTNEVLAAFYRYFLLIAAIPITAVCVALINLTDDGISAEARFLAYSLFGISTLLLSVIGAAVIAYIEGLRLDAILYARVVNSIRDYFFKLPGSEKFGVPVLPTKTDKPTYGGFGAGFVIYFACATMNAAYFGAGVMAMTLNYSSSLIDVEITCVQKWCTGGAFVLMLGAQAFIRSQLLKGKVKKGF